MKIERKWVWLQMRLLFILMLFIFTSCTNQKEKDSRAPSPPFITGDAFRNYADIIFDETRTSFDPKKVKDGNVIFVKTDFLEKFFFEYHPKIKKRYILITHNSDCEVPGKYIHFLDDPKLIAWFGQNVIRAHKKLIPIPIGVENRYCGGGKVEEIKRIQKEKLVKTNLLYMNFEPTTSLKERSCAYNMFFDKPFCKVSKRVPYQSFFRDIFSSWFVLSPRGNGFDCHRTWEALYLDAIPIVKTSPSDSLFDDLPVLIVKDWSEIDAEFLKNASEVLSKKKYNMEKLHFSYWTKEIDSYKPKNSSIIFVHIGKELPAFLETAISQAHLFNEGSNIFLVANREAKRPFILPPYVTFVPCESLKRSKEHEYFLLHTKLDTKFMDGFWRSATERFFYLYELIDKYDLKQVVHLESDVMLYVDIKELMPIFKKSYSNLGAPFDNQFRCIPSFVYVKDANAIHKLVKFLMKNSRRKADMENLSFFLKNYGTYQIGPLPIITDEYLKDYHLDKLFAANFSSFHSIFDAAALGQYFGGQAPWNGPCEPGFINELCIFNPSFLEFKWEKDEKGRKVPYASYKGKTFRINNLHIHSKNLKRFSSLEQL